MLVALVSESGCDFRFNSRFGNVTCGK